MAAERSSRRTRRFDDDGWEPSSPPSLLGFAHDREPDCDRDDFHEPGGRPTATPQKGPSRCRRGWSPIPGRSTPTTV